MPVENRGQNRIKALLSVSFAAKAPMWVSPKEMVLGVSMDRKGDLEMHNGTDTRRNELNI